MSKSQIVTDNNETSKHEIVVKLFPNLFQVYLQIQVTSLSCYSYTNLQQSLLNMSYIQLEKV